MWPGLIMAMLIAIGCTTGESARVEQEKPMKGFEIHVIRGFGDEPTSADDPAAFERSWREFLATAPLGELYVGDAAIEAVTLDPLTLVLSPAAGRELVAKFGRTRDHRFVATLDGDRLFAGRIVFVGTARWLQHPVIHVGNTGPAITLTILPVIGAKHDNPTTTPPALIDHFRRTGRLAAAELPPAYGFQSSLTLDQMLGPLNAAGPWAWTARDSDTHGDYLLARPDTDNTRVRIIRLRSGFVVDIAIAYSRSAEARGATRVALEPILIDRVLPAIAARDVVPSKGYF